MPHNKVCFVISPIGEPDSETRKRSDQILRHVIRPAVESCGYQAKRADEIDKPGLITSHIIQHVVECPLVVADLTEKNPNVFYELAIRHAIRRPFIQIIRKGDAIPFDVAGTRTISVDHNDLDSAEAAKNEIIKQVRALQEDSTDIETPISVSLDLQALRQSEKPEERSLADLVAGVADLRTSQRQVLEEIQTDIGALPIRLRSILSEYLAGRRTAAQFGPARVVFQNAIDAAQAIEDRLIECLSADDQIYVRWLGMSMFNAWNTLVTVLEKVLPETSTQRVHVQVAMLDSRWAGFPAINETWANQADAVQRQILGFADRPFMRPKGHTVSVGLYAHMPCVHGLLLNERYAIMGNCSWEHGVMYAGTKWYELFSGDDPYGRSRILLFKGWFDYCFAGPGSVGETKRIAVPTGPAARS